MNHRFKTLFERLLKVQCQYYKNICRVLQVVLLDTYNSQFLSAYIHIYIYMQPYKMICYKTIVGIMHSCLLNNLIYPHISPKNNKNHSFNTFSIISNTTFSWSSTKLIHRIIHVSCTI